MTGFVQRILHPARMLYPARILHPAWYHGHDKRPPFFEGWYFKLIDASRRHRYAIIPGIFKSDVSERHHAFVQVLNGTTGRAVYHRFPAEAFRAAEDRFEICVGPNRFTGESISLQLDSPEQTLHGEVHFEGLTPWPVTLISPGIMGWYSWVPSMECYHGVLSLDHALRGAFTVDGQTIDWSRGQGYNEKDWGSSFPSAWIWLQSNHFARDPGLGAPRTSLTASVAIIPWRRSSFRGMIVGLWHGGRLYRFATYTGARIEQLSLDDEQVTWIVRGRMAIGGPTYQLEMRATRAQGGLIRGPSTSDMGVRVPETLSASVEVRLARLRGRQETVLLEDTGRYAGLEVVGDLERLLQTSAMKRRQVSSDMKRDLVGRKLR